MYSALKILFYTLQKAALYKHKNTIWSFCGLTADSMRLFIDPAIKTQDDDWGLKSEDLSFSCFSGDALHHEDCG